MTSPGKTQPITRLLPVCIVVLFILSVMTAANGGELSTIDDVLHIQNSDQPTQGVRTLVLEEIWRVGGEGGDLFFGQITRVRADAAGNIYVLDAQMQQAHVFSPDGELLHTLFGRGEGPGEINSAVDMALWPDGSVGAVTMFPGRIVSVQADGTPISASRGGNVSLVSFQAIQQGGGNTVIACVRHLETQRELTSANEYYLASIGEQGEELRRYVETSREADYQNNFVFDEDKSLNNFLNAYAVGPDGRVYVAVNRDEYKISVFNPDGSLDRIIERQFEPRRRTAFERARIEAMIERRFRTFPFDLTTDIKDSEPVVAWQHRGMSVAPDGNLWVRHSRSGDDCPTGVVLAFDVFDCQGHYLEKVNIACEGEPEFDGVFVFSEHVVLVKGFPDSMRSALGGGRGPLLPDSAEVRVPEVVCFRIVR